MNSKWLTFEGCLKRNDLFPQLGLPKGVLTYNQTLSHANGPNEFLDAPGERRGAGRNANSSKLASNSVPSPAPPLRRPGATPDVRGAGGVKQHLNMHEKFAILETMKLLSCVDGHLSRVMCHLSQTPTAAATDPPPAKSPACTVCWLSKIEILSGGP